MRCMHAHLDALAAYRYAMMGAGCCGAGLEEFGAPNA